MCGWAFFHIFGKLYIGIWWLFALNQTHIIYEAPNMISTFVLMLPVIILTFIDWRHGWGVFMHINWFTCGFITLLGKLYVFDSYYAFNHTHIMSEALNLISSFVFMLLVIIPSFIDWRHDWALFSRCVDEHINIRPTVCIYVIAYWLLIIHTSYVKLQTSSVHLCWCY